MPKPCQKPTPEKLAGSENLNSLATSQPGKASNSNERSITCLSQVMTIVSPTRRILRKKNQGAAPTDSRFDRRLAEILEHAIDVFCEKGYAGASMRDLSRATGMSLAGLYYYFESKEKLLYLIQKHTFETIFAELRLRLADVSDPEERLRIFIRNHLQYFLANQKGMKVLSHEDEALTNHFGEELRAIKREYYQACSDLVEALKVERGLEFPTRLSVLSLFGMINWIYTWHNPQLDDAESVASHMSDIFLRGVLNSNKPAPLVRSVVRGRRGEPSEFKLLQQAER
jgi:TetR/AcrR family transcriptional regulator, cholesterol catabolism regulator